MSDEKKGTLSLNPRVGAGTLRSRSSRRATKPNEVDVVQRRKRLPSKANAIAAASPTPTTIKIAKGPPAAAKNDAPLLEDAAKSSDSDLSPTELARRAKALLLEQKRRADEIRTQKEIEERQEAARRKKIEEAKEEKRKAEEAKAKLREKELREKEIEEKNRESEKLKEQQRKAEVEKAKPATSPKIAFGKKAEPKREKEQPISRARREPTRRRSGKITLNQALNDDASVQRSLAALRRRQEREKKKAKGEGAPVREKVFRDVQLPESIVVQELANRMAERVADVVKSLMNNGIMVTQNQSIDADTAELIIEEFGHKAVRVSDADVEDVIGTVEDDPVTLMFRPPVITVMGHVDHGKTSLLDSIRKTSVASGEAGGITQHIGAYQVKSESGQAMTFLDTPGHAAFTSMRARGAEVTDIVVLVVAADDSVMPQTVEAINHAKAAGVPMIVAINKCDKHDANADQVRNQLLNHDVIVEERSGDVLDVELSALTGDGIDELLDAISLQTEMMELRANPERVAEGAVIEAKLDVGRGPVATVLVQKGTLRSGDVFVVGEQWGKVRALLDDKGKRVRTAGPSVPVEVLGLNGTPAAGDVLNVVKNESQAREIAAYRHQVSRERRAAAGGTASLEQMISDARNKSGSSELRVVVKADVQGSAEAISQAIEKIGNEEVSVRTLHSGVGAITETDIGLAEASDALVFGFNVRANAPARGAANRKGIDLRYYSVIYDLVEDVKSIASGMLSTEVRENFLGQAEIREIFKVSGVGNVAGCLVVDGVVKRSASVRLLRDNVVIHEGRLKTLKRFKDEVKEVRSGQECGMAFENYANMRKGDFIEIFEQEEIERSLA
ncbi:MAG: translation initiation factor IF-2 [Albidovulum sp.]|nr:translation initiation factor IF-2 [Albidovulum sp.]